MNTQMYNFSYIFALSAALMKLYLLKGRLFLLEHTIKK